MKKKEKVRPPGNDDEELIDRLIAISVVAKRLAQNLKNESQPKEENPSEKDERIINYPSYWMKLSKPVKS